LWNALSLREGEVESGSTIGDFVEADDDIVTSDAPTLPEIARYVAEFDPEEQSSDDE
jgi:hypothetical protein